MMKSFIKLLFAFALSALLLSACAKDNYDYKGEIESIKTQLASQKAMIDMLQQAVTITDIQKSDGSYTITFSNGQSITITDGYTPLITIGENGNWFINGQDTGKPSKGKDGTDGKDGKTYKIEIGSDGYWYINGQNTGVKAVGKDGKNGADAPYITAIFETDSHLSFCFSDGSVKDVYKESYARVSSERTSVSLVAASSAHLSENYILPRNLTSAAIYFDSFSNVQIGRGYGKQGGWMLEITPSDVIIRKYGTSSYAEEKTEAHGLAIKGAVYVSIDADWDGATISLYSDGKEFSTSSSWNAVGPAFVYNSNGSVITADLTFFPYDVESSCWVIGDENVDGWAAKIHSLGASPLVDRKPGASASDMLASFKTDLMFGNPRFALWTPYSGDKADEGAVDQSWLKATQDFIDLCQQRGITPVLATIPSSAGHDNSYKTSWVRAGKCRYADLASAAPDAGAMAYRLMVDLPELLNCLSSH